MAAQRFFYARRPPLLSFSFASLPLIARALVGIYYC